MSAPYRATTALLLALLLQACGDSATEPGESHEVISGSYSGAMAGVSQGILMESVFSLTINQNRGDLTGTWATTGILTDGIDTVPIQGTGAITGSIAPGSNPSVNFTLTSAFCPNQPASFSGTYDSANRRLNLAGPVHIYSDTCQVLLTYPMNVVLTR